MTTDLDHALRETASSLRLQTPVEHILLRGARIRRRRQRGMMGGVVGGVAAVAGVATLALPAGTGIIPAAQAGWGPAMVNLDKGDLAAADALCRDSFNPSGGEGVSSSKAPGVDTGPVAADVRGDHTVLIYRIGEMINGCSVFTPPDPIGAIGVAATLEARPWAMSEDAGHFEDLFGAGYLPVVEVSPEADPASVDPLESIYADRITALRVSDEVARVVAHVGGKDIEARVSGGLAVYWDPQNVTARERVATTITVYDAEGNELETGPVDPAPADQPVRQSLR